MTSIVFSKASSAMVNFLYWSSILSRDLEEMWLTVAAGITDAFVFHEYFRIMWIYNAPIFSIPSCVFIGPLGNTNIGGRLTSQEVAVLLVGCHFLGGRPKTQTSTWKFPKIRPRGVGVVVVKSVHAHKDSQKTVGGRTTSREYGDHQTRHLSKLGGGKRHPRRDVFVKSTVFASL